MEQTVEKLAGKIVSQYQQLMPGRRIIVGVAGVPGAGKSTLAYPLTELINEKLGAPVLEQHIDRQKALVNQSSSQGTRIAISVSLDGWHTTRADLDKMLNPVEARLRRGAAFTFDADDYVQFVKDLRKDPCLPEVHFRTFSHSKKDPEPGAFPITPVHQIVVIEGLYTLLSTEPWKQATYLLDERIWVDCPDEIAASRLIARHVATGVEPDLESARKRVEDSDMQNGIYIRQNLVTPTVTVESILDDAYAELVERKLAS